MDPMGICHGKIRLKWIIYGGTPIYARSHDGQRSAHNDGWAEKRNMTNTFGRSESLIPNTVSKLENETPSTSTSSHNSPLPQAPYCESGDLLEWLNNGLTDVVADLSRVLPLSRLLSGVSFQVPAESATSARRNWWWPASGCPYSNPWHFHDMNDSQSHLDVMLQVRIFHWNMHYYGLHDYITYSIGNVTGKNMLQ